MKGSRGGYRETESGLGASFLWSHDKSEKEGERGRDRGGGAGVVDNRKLKDHAKPQEEERGKRERRRS